MAVTKTFARLSSSPTISTGIVTTLKVAEGAGTPNTLDALKTLADAAVTAVNGGTGAAEVAAVQTAIAAMQGLTANLNAKNQVDVNESGSTSLKDLFTYTSALVLGANSDARPVVTVVATPILGDGSLGTSQQIVVEHPQTMDAFQTAAGRARQAS